MVILSSQQARGEARSSGRDKPTQKEQIAFISRHLNEEGERLVLSPGPGADIFADVVVCGDQVEYESNLPAWVTLSEIYEHVRWREMSPWDRRACYKRTAIVSANAQIAALVDAVADRIDSSLAVKSAKLESSDYRFEKVGEIWHIHFRFDGRVKRVQLTHRIALDTVAKLLRYPTKKISSEELSGNDDVTTADLIAADKLKGPEPIYEGVTVDTLLKIKQNLEHELSAARQQGCVSVIEDKEEELRVFQKTFGSGPDEFKRALGRTLQLKSLKLSIHGTVRRRLSRLRADLRGSEINMPELADYIAARIKPEGCGFVYCPLPNAPKWKL